jgi:Zn-dependent M16 (insulinase) family peptidase
MNTVKIMLAAFVMSAFISSAAFAGIFKKGETYYGFKLIDKHFVKEVNAECFYFEHVKSGAKLLKIAANDKNKTFSITFKTDPESDYGTPHIMEHSVLNGSKNFPVKSPFDILMKGSLNTFINAMTSSDATTFPCASMNEKDYYNLMHIYLDAVFNPLLHSDPRIFKQEGWHCELEKPDAPASYKGVVYNEMKGAFSDPNRELDYLVNKFLFPDNGYKYTSGGYPMYIPKLTYKAFTDFHKKYYHPSNSYIFLYGDAELDKELQFIDSEYLSNYKKEPRPESFPLQKTFNSMKEIQTSYAVPEGGKTDDQTFISLNYVAGLNIDRTLVLALDIISQALFNQESAPGRLALQKAGIGKNVSAEIDEKRQNIFSVTVQNANPADKDKFREIVINTLKEAADKGIDPKAVEGIINRTEFSLREGNNSQKGLFYASLVRAGWFWADNPFLSLEYEKTLKEIKPLLEKKYLEKTIKDYILNNQHAVLVVLEPKPGLEKENNLKIEKELQAYKASLSEAEKEALVKETKELMEYQKQEDAPEAVAKMPLLEKKDINPKAEWFQIQEKQAAKIPVLQYEDFSNNIIYAKFMFDMRVLPQELIPYGQLLSDILGQQNTEKYTFGELEKEIDINTGGINTGLSVYLEDKNDNNLTPKFVVSGKSMNKKADKLFELTGEIINKTKYSDAERLKTILTKLQARTDASVKRNGMAYAQTRTLSYFSNAGMFNELTNGFEYYWFLNGLVKSFPEKSKEICDNLAKTASLLFNRNNMVAAVTCSKEDYPVFTGNLEKFASSLAENPVELKKWNFNFEKKNEGFLTASKVQYVVKGYNLKKLGYKWDGKINVLSQIISSDWLQNRVRVLGGAYGGFSTFTESGTALFSSYRDPNLKETLDTYDAIPEYLDKLQADDKEMTRYIIGTIASIDRPMTTPQKGSLAVKYYFEKVKPEDIQAGRDAILNVTLKDIKDMKKMVSDILNQKAYCVYGSEAKINSQKELFGSVKSLTK